MSEGKCFPSRTATPEGRTNVLPSPQAKAFIIGVESGGKKGLSVMDVELDAFVETWENKAYRLRWSEGYGDRAKLQTRLRHENQRLQQPL